jgi:hypothetical protein
MRMLMCSFLVACLTLLAFPLLGQSAHLVCDPYPTTAHQPTSFLLTFDGGTPIETPATVKADGSVWLYYDLTGLANGAHTVTCQSKDVWGVSASSVPLSFVKPATVLGLPTNVKVAQ